MASNTNEINITTHLEKFQKVLGETNIPVLALLTCVSDIAVEIRHSLISQEVLATKDALHVGLIYSNNSLDAMGIYIKSE